MDSANETEGSASWQAMREENRAMRQRVEELERREAEEALRQSQTRLTRIIQGTGDAVWEWPDLSREENWWSPRFFEMLGYQPNEFVPTTCRFLELMHPDDRASHASRMPSLLESNEPFESEYRLRHKSGEYRWFLVRGRIFRDQPGGLACMSGSVRDITGQKLAEQEAQSAQHFLRAVLRSLPGRVAVLDEHGVIVMTNDAWASCGRANGVASAFREGDVNYLEVARSATGLWSEGASQACEAIEAILAGTRHDFRMEYPCRSPDRQRWFDVEAQGFSCGNRRYVILAHIDITERKRAETALVENGPREVEDRSLDYPQRLRSLAAELALAEERERRRIGLGLHDNIAQGLAMMKLSLQTLCMTADEETANVLTRNCSQIDGLVDEIRSLSFELSNSILYTVGLPEAVEAHLEQHIRRERGIASEFQRTGDFTSLDPEIKVMLFRSYRELMNNVVTYAGARHVSVRLARSSIAVILRVQDDGMGFDTEEAAAFDTDRVHFGLFSVSEQTKTFGGSLKIRSKPGRGTCILLRIPARCRPELAGRFDRANTDRR